MLVMSLKRDYSKILENLRNKMEVRLVRNSKDYIKLVSTLSFVSQNIQRKFDSSSQN